MEEEIEINGSEFWIKVVEFLQQNWALIENRKGKSIIWFINDNSAIFDSLEFPNKEEAEAGLMWNGFSKFSASNYPPFIQPPKPPFHRRMNNIYSSGRFWKY